MLALGFGKHKEFEPVSSVLMIEKYFLLIFHNLIVLVLSNMK